MRVKFIFINNVFHHNNIEKWVELDIIPRIEEWVETEDILSKSEHDITYENSTLWSGDIGTVWTVKLRKDENGFYYEIKILCEDT